MPPLILALNLATMCCFCDFDDSILLVYDAYYAHTLQIIVCHMGLMLCP
jgi:hypothetical protein